MHKLFTDGGSRGNPGNSASAYLIFDEQNLLVDCGGEFNGIQTNNYAEYQGLLLGLKAALKLALPEIHIFMDSELVVKQIKGEYKIANEELKKFHTKIINLMNEFQEAKISHVERAQNKFADKLVNMILDANEKNL